MNRISENCEILAILHIYINEVSEEKRKREKVYLKK